MTNTLHQTDFSAQRTSFDQKILPWIEGLVRFIATHWLALMNTALAIFAGLPILSPILEASDSPALQSVGQAIFWGYQATCHQLPYRSFFILGHQVAWCERDTSIWITFLLAGLVFGLLRRRLTASLDIKWFILLCIPMAIDGGTQLFGFRESTWELRLITGFLFGLGSAWVVLPILERGMNEVKESTAKRVSDSDHRDRL